MAKDVKVFVQNYLHCVVTILGDKVLRPLRTQLHATKPNEILHFDFLYTGLSRDGKYQYLLFLKDDLRRYLWLVPKELKAAHATRLRFYKDKELSVTAEMAQAAEHNDHQLYVVSKILDARHNEQEVFRELLVAWRRFPVGEAPWEPYSVMAVDVLGMVTKFMESHDDYDTVRKLRSIREFSWGNVMRFKDETSVDIICRRFSCNFLRERRI
jgi:hypothetical protein